MKIDFQYLGSYLIALVNLIALGFTIYFSRNNRAKINSMNSINDTLNTSNEQLRISLSEIRREIGIGTEVDARNVLAKKYEIDELRKQVGALEASNQINLSRNELLEKQYESLNQILIAQQGAQKSAQAELDYKKELDRLEKKPIFKFYSGSRSPYGKSYALNLMNYGGTAELLGARCDDPNIQISIGVGQLINQNEKLGISWNDKLGGDIRKEYLIEIIYRDLLENGYVYQLYWNKEWNKSKNLTIQEEA